MNSWLLEASWFRLDHSYLEGGLVSNSTTINTVATRLHQIVIGLQ
jgi:hypothetical protein